MDDIQKQLRSMRILVQQMGWGPFMRHVGSLMAEQSDRVPDGPQATALRACSRTVHALNEPFTECGKFQYPPDKVED